jgi:hypothetical protein
MSPIDANHLFLQQKIDHFESAVSRAKAMVSQARTVMDVVRAHNSLPSAPGLISWSPEVSRARGAANLAFERAAKEVVTKEFANLDALFAGGPKEEFKRRLGTFQRDLRYLGPIASNVMRYASQHIWRSYRFKRDIHQSAHYQIHTLTPIDERDQFTQGDLQPGTILCMANILYEQGLTVAATKDASGAVISVGYHVGRASYVFCDERRPLSQQYDFGTLHQSIERFESALGVTLPKIKVIWPGYGVWEAHQKYTSDTADNPWRLQAGRQYEVTYARSGKTGRYLANEDGTVTNVNATSNLRALPKDIWGHVEWLSLREAGQTELQAPRERG